jgi:hypothetical protein|tara:strand:- start:36 stop:377 length:342 start_codon:yes stop_codon:yes gene_type:complete
MALDHDAIFRAYSGTVVSVDDETNAAYDVNHNKVTLEDAKITAARSEIDTEEAAVKYQKDRVGYPHSSEEAYASVGDQLDLLWHAIDADADLKSKFSGFYNSIKSVKDKYPKP